MANDDQQQRAIEENYGKKLSHKTLRSENGDGQDLHGGKSKTTLHSTGTLKESEREEDQRTHGSTQQKQNQRTWILTENTKSETKLKSLDCRSLTIDIVMWYVVIAYN